MTYYYKTGRKYVPFHDGMALGGLSDGYWLVVVEKGATTCRRLLNPDHAQAEADLTMVRQRLIDSLMESAEWQPMQRPLTEREQKALAAYKAIAGKDSMLVFTRDSAENVVDRALRGTK